MPLADTEVRFPKDLRVPDEVVRAFQELSPHLTESGLNELVSDLITALQHSARLNNLSPVQQALAAWYRTLILMSQADFREVMDQPTPDRREALTAEEIQARHKQ